MPQSRFTSLSWWPRSNRRNEDAWCLFANTLGVQVDHQTNTPWKINDWNLKNHLFEKENHLPSTFIFGMHVNFQGCSLLEKTIILCSRDLESTIPGNYFFDGLWLPGNRERMERSWNNGYIIGCGALGKSQWPVSLTSSHTSSGFGVLYRFWGLHTFFSGGWPWMSRGW